MNGREMSPADLRKVHVDEYPKKTRTLKKILGNTFIDFMIERNLYVAGGACRDIFAGLGGVSDIDIYGYSIKDVVDAAEAWIPICDGSIFAKTGNAITIKAGDGKIFQFITAITGIPESVIKQFDFTVCMCAYDPGISVYIMHKDFLPDLAARQLIVNPCANYPLASIMRIPKYLKKGFSISGIETVKLSLMATEADVSTMDKAKEQLMGIDIIILMEVFALMEKDCQTEWKDAMDLLDKIGKYIDKVHLLEDV